MVENKFGGPRKHHWLAYRHWRHAQRFTRAAERGARGDKPTNGAFSELRWWKTNSELRESTIGWLIATGDTLNDSLETLSVSPVAISQPMVLSRNSDGGKQIRLSTRTQLESFIHCSSSFGISISPHSPLSIGRDRAHSIENLAVALGCSSSPCAPAKITSDMLSQSSHLDPVGGIGNRQHGSMKKNSSPWTRISAENE